MDNCEIAIVACATGVLSTIAIITVAFNISWDTPTPLLVIIPIVLLTLIALAAVSR